MPWHHQVGGEIEDEHDHDAEPDYVERPDGVIEAVELPEHPFGLAVQWHPEWLTDQEPTLRLFEAFVAAAREALAIHANPS